MQTLEQDYAISPEALTIVQTYLECHDTAETALTLGCEPEKVSYYLRKPDVKRFIDNIFLEQGYMNRSKLQDIMDKLFEIKLEEMLDSEMGTSKDILDLIKMQNDMRSSAFKESEASSDSSTKINQINVSGGANFGANYDSLLGKLIEAG